MQYYGNDRTGRNDSLQHLKKGAQKQGAKYVKREFKNGKWVYTYPNDVKNAMKNNRGSISSLPDNRGTLAKAKTGLLKKKHELKTKVNQAKDEYNLKRAQKILNDKNPDKVVKNQKEANSIVKKDRASKKKQLNKAIKKGKNKVEKALKNASKKTNKTVKKIKKKLD